MSDTDSENDYASADEDTEESVSKSEDVICHGQSSSVAVSETIETGDVSETTETGDVSKMIETGNVSETIETGGVSKPLFKSVEKLEISNLKHEVETSNASPVDKSSTDRSISETNRSVSETNKSISETDSQVSETNRSVLETDPTANIASQQPKRVTLRLEKRLKERNQQASISNDSKDSPPKAEEKTTASWGFGSWGSSLLSTAASSVTTFTNQVSQGIGTVLETVETTLGAPPPEELATILKEKREKEEQLENQIQRKDESVETVETEAKESANESDSSPTPASTVLFTGVTSLTKVVGDTGSKVLMGGLDTLELIGKKTMNIITERDPGLRNTRSTLSSGMTLSHMLREAKEEAEANQKSLFEDEDETVYYSQMFDEHNGLVHLEALEMLSNQNESELQRAIANIADDTHRKNIIDEIAKICDIQPSDDLPSPTEISQDFDSSILEDLEPEQLSITFEKIKTVRDVAHTWVDDCLQQQEKGEKMDAKEIHRQAITNLAYFTAKCIEQFHKFGELIMVIQNVGENETLTSAKNLKRLTTFLSKEINIVTAKYCQCLNTAADDSEDPDSVAPLITSVYLEASNSTTCIHDALQLLVPVLQMALL